MCPVFLLIEHDPTTFCWPRWCKAGGYENRTEMNAFRKLDKETMALDDLLLLIYCLNADIQDDLNQRSIWTEIVNAIEVFYTGYMYLYCIFCHQLAI